MKMPASLDRFGDKWVIRLRKGDSLSEHLRSMAHEFGHLYFGAKDPKHLAPDLSEPEYWNSENFIEERAAEFCADPDNWAYLESLYWRIQEKNSNK